MNVDEARALMQEWTQSVALRTHMECVAVCMAAYAERYEADQRDRWIVAGLLHDMDYDRHPTREEHPFVAVEHLRRRGDAVDELAGFIVACCKVRPNGIADLQPKSVRKKLKDKAFAAGVNRADIHQGVDELEVDATEHIQLCIDALRAEAERLGL
jgi:predicted hydrolase (HD superfamily)